MAVGCLVGNGFSIAFNPDLSMPKLSQDLVAEFSEMTGGAAEEVLASFASRFGGAKASDFEGLLGPLDDVSTALQELRGLLDMTSESQASVAKALRKSASFVRMLHRVGFGTALNMISVRARAQQNIAFGRVVRRTCSALHDTLRDEDDWLAVGTLNYDGLIHAGFLDLVPSGDLVLAVTRKSPEAAIKNPQPRPREIPTRCHEISSRGV